MKEQIIKQIYQNTIDTILLNVPENLKQEVVNAYFKYLVKNYLDDDLEESDIEIYTDLELSTWKLASIDLKLSEILEDKEYENIKNISNVGYKLAKQRLKESPNCVPVINYDMANNYIKKLENSLDGVRKFNKQRAIQVVSEGIMDFTYASGKTENMSLRTGRHR